jgi:hypothetical protein
MTTVERNAEWESNNMHLSGDGEEEWNDSNSSSKIFERSRIKALAGRLFDLYILGRFPLSHHVKTTAFIYKGEK